MRELCSKTYSILRFVCILAVVGVFLPQTVMAAAETETISEEAQIEKGQPNLLLDGIGNIISIPKKVILWNSKVDSHNIGPETEKYLTNFIEDNPDEMKDVKVRINQWTPVGDFRHLIKNKKVSWWWRVFPGIPITLFSSTTGRIFGGDHYNPYTDTICLYSDVPTIALHEAIHAKDFAEKARDGGNADWYAVGRILPPLALEQETIASEGVIDYFKKNREREKEMESYRTLYPAFGTYVGGYSGIPYGNIAGAMGGHVAGLWKQHEQQISYSATDGARRGKEKVVNIKSDPIACRLLMYSEQRRASLDSILSNREAPKYFK